MLAKRVNENGEVRERDAKAFVFVSSSSIRVSVVEWSSSSTAASL
jgi:hypothetical protein